jgi:hypothetical protein
MGPIGFPKRRYEITSTRCVINQRSAVLSCQEKLWFVNLWLSWDFLIGWLFQDWRVMQGQLLGWFVDSEWERLCKEAVVYGFEEMSGNFPVWTAEAHAEPRYSPERECTKGRPLPRNCSAVTRHKSGWQAIHNRSRRQANCHFIDAWHNFFSTPGYKSWCHGGTNV